MEHLQMTVSWFDKSEYFKQFHTDNYKILSLRHQIGNFTV